MNMQRLAVSVLIAAVVGSAVGVVVVKHESRQLFVQSQELIRTRDRLNVEWGMLQLEQGAWATHGRVEQLGRERLKMRIPQRDDLVIIKN
jgi:cell division protein FtsL